VIDSGAFPSYTRNKRSLTNYYSTNGSVGTAKEGSSITTVGTGTLKHRPELSVDLLSVGSMCDQGLEVKFRKHDCTFTNSSGDIVLSGKRDSGLYYYESSDFGQMLMAAGDTTLAELAHRRLGHLHYRGLQQLTSLVDGLVIGK
jgi:hypothetical protein